MRKGRLLLEAPGRLALSPDGHGGMLAAMAGSGVLADVQRRGVRHLFYFQVDNPLVGHRRPVVPRLPHPRRVRDDQPGDRQA